MEQLERPLVFHDLETTGTSITQDRIVEIALIKVYPLREKVTFHSYFNPGIAMNPEAAEVTGLSDEFLSDKPKFTDRAAEILSFIEGCDLAGHNILTFDIPMLAEELARCGFDFPKGVRYVDTVRLEEKILPRTLEACFKRYTGRDPGQENLHGASFDAEASAIIFGHQVKALYPGQDFSIEDLHKISTRDRIIVDFSGKLKLNETGHIVYAFGKNEGKRVSSDLNYCDWMLKGDFTNDTKRWIHHCIRHQDQYEPKKSE